MSNAILKTLIEYGSAAGVAVLILHFQLRRRVERLEFKVKILVDMWDDEFYRSQRPGSEVK